MYVFIDTPAMIIGTSRAEADELRLTDGESYYAIVRATNQLGFVHTVHSDGITVQLEPLLPGTVRDGDIVGEDLDYQMSVTSLSASWEGFGQPKDDDTDIVASGTCFFFKFYIHIIIFTEGKTYKTKSLFCYVTLQSLHNIEIFIIQN